MNSTEKKGLPPALKQAILFTLLSCTAAVVEVSSYYLLIYTVLREPSQVGAAQAISLALSVIYNFTVNRKFTFKDTGNVPIAMMKVAAFYVVFIPLSSWLSQLCIDAQWLAFATKDIEAQKGIIKFISLIANFIGEFLWWKFVVFGDAPQRLWAKISKK